MESMQSFYAQLFSADTGHSAYLKYLIELTRLSRGQVASLQTVLWWNGWDSQEA